ncbi:hypothetical protein FJZ40_01290 [Candidatus Shapirobacteria bacterium]|nr:hypothetical protein [Candidatus Shapirobacteria bacterium]
MYNLITYPTQMASIKKNKWRMQDSIDKKLSLGDLIREEEKLWKSIKKIADGSGSPSIHLKYFKGSKLLGYGWEWAVYEFNKTEVIKVPAGIFPEVNNKDYFKNTNLAHNVCKKFLRDFVVESSFQRKKFDGNLINIIFQKKLNSKQCHSIVAKELPQILRRDLAKLGKGLLKMLSTWEWMPDMNLYEKSVGGKRLWNIWNLMLENGHPQIFDFTSYYDVFRLYPERTKQEVKTKGQNWEKFIKELSS